jgi:hypothetical protein
MPLGDVPNIGSICAEKTFQLGNIRETAIKTGRGLPA